MHSIAITLYNQCWGSSVASVLDFFRIVQLVDRYLGQTEDSYRISLLSEQGQSIMASSGVLFASQIAEPEQPYDLIIVPSVEAVQMQQVVADNAWLISFLRQQIQQQRSRLLSITTGVCFLAATEQVNDVLLSSHWAFIKLLARTFSQCQFTASQAFTQRRQIITTANTQIVNELLLRLVEQHKGSKFANLCRGYLLLEGAEQALPVLPQFRQHSDRQIFKVQDWLDEHYQQRCSLEQLAQQFGFSQRNLRRRFVQAVGLAPNQYLQQLRLAQAKQMLRLSTLSIKEISFAVGYEDSSFLTHMFKSHTGTTPSAWRKANQLFNRPSHTETERLPVLRHKKTVLIED